MLDIVLPTGRRVSFKPITFYDRQQAARRYERGSGYSLEEYMAVLALQKIDDRAVNQELYSTYDPMDLVNNWTHVEAQFYFEVFNNTCLLDERGRLAAIEQAKNVMGAGRTPMPQAPGTQGTRPPRGSGNATTEV